MVGSDGMGGGLQAESVGDSVGESRNSAKGMEGMVGVGI